MQFRLQPLIFAAAFFATSSVQAATLVADYEFNGNLASSVAGAPDLIAINPLGTNNFGTGVYNFGGASSPPGNQGGLAFDNAAGLISNTSYSIALRFMFNGGDGAWRRIVDVQNRQSDDGFYVDPSNSLDIYPVTGSPATFTTGIFHDVLLTVDGGVVTAYLDGALQFAANTNVMNIDNPQNVVNLFVDNVVGGGQNEWSSGSIDYVKFYDGIASINGAVPEPATWAMMIIGFGFVGAAMRRTKPSVSLA